MPPPPPLPYVGPFLFSPSMSLPPAKEAAKGSQNTQVALETVLNRTDSNSDFTLCSPPPQHTNIPHPAFSSPGPSLNVPFFWEPELLHLFFPFSLTLLRNKEHLAPSRLLIPNHCLNQDGDLHSMGAPVWSISCQFLPNKVPTATYPALPGSKAGSPTPT